MWQKVEQGVVEAFREAKAPDLAALSTASLERLADSARTECEALGRRILEESGGQKQAAEAGDWAAFERHREAIKRLQEDWDSLRETIGDIQELVRRKHLQERVVERLGSHGRAVALEVIILALIGVVLAVLAWELWAEQRIPETVDRWRGPLAVLDTVICGIFLVEFFWKMSLADSRSWYFRRHWIDFVSSLPVALLGWGLLRVGRAVRVVRVARAARLARLVRLMRLARALRGLAFVFRGFDKITQSLNIRVLNRPLIATTIFLVIGGLAMGMIPQEKLVEGADAWVDAAGQSVEEGQKPQSEASGLADERKPPFVPPRFARGLWWSFTTVCTGGFADIHDPQTGWGQLLTILLVILGAILTGAFTAALASVLLGDDTERIELKLGAVLDRLPRENGS